MNIFKYWAESHQDAIGPGNKKYFLLNWQGSDVSVEDARNKAVAHTGEIAQKLARGEPLERYGYSDRPLREEIKEAVVTLFKTEVGIVTRNAYGSLVLNSTTAMFIDIDIPGMDQPRRGGLFGGGKESFNPDSYMPSVRNVEDWAGRHSHFAVRIYATFAGLRCLITNTVFNPKSDEALRIMQDLKSDPLYVRLCIAQECFRARLTPKPWRCGMRQPAGRLRFPREDARIEGEYRAWEKKYEAAAAKYSTCRMIRHLGPQDVHPDIEPILALHDRTTCIESKLPLA
jgi:hypothetical protein